jgi:hypothetical protein
MTMSKKKHINDSNLLLEARYLLEQPDSKMPGQIEKFGYKQNDASTLGPALQRQKEYLESMDTHTLLTIGSVVTAFIPVVGPLISAGLSLADASIYLSEGDKKSAGLSAIFAVLPGLTGVVAKIPLIKNLGSNGMKLLADKIIKNGAKAKLTKQELGVVNSISQNQSLITQELNNYSKNVASKYLNNTKNAKLKSTLSSIAKGGLKFSGQVAGYGSVAYIYDKLYQDEPSSTDLVKNLSTVKPTAASYQAAKSIQW